jgi:hypothetical protein
MRKFLPLAFALWASVASAQTPNTTKPSLINMLTANCTAAQMIVGSATNPACGPTAITAGDVVYFNGTNFVVLSGNNSGTKFLQETAAGVPSWATVAGSGTVTSVTCGTGLDGGTFTSTGTCSLSAARRTGQTISKCLSSGTGCSNGGFGGTGTYTTPANVLSLDITMTGGGGGGEGSGTTHGNGGAGTDTCWNTTGAACTTPVYDAGGASGGNATTGGPGGITSGSATCDIGLSGTRGSSTNGAATTSAGGQGGGNPFGPGGAGGAPGTGGFAGPVNSGNGGGGAADNGTAGPGAGGGGSAYCTVHISAPAATYTYTVGAGGSAGTAGTGGTAGSVGAIGGIWVKENYNTN